MREALSINSRGRGVLGGYTFAAVALGALGCQQGEISKLAGYGWVGNQGISGGRRHYSKALINPVHPAFQWGEEWGI